MSGWRADAKWADGYVPEVKAILTRNAIHFQSFERASAEQDQRQATDFVAVTQRGAIAVRVRREDCEFRDLTIRVARRAHPDALWCRGYEADKLIDGWGAAYLYCWVRP